MENETWAVPAVVSSSRLKVGALLLWHKSDFATLQ